MSRTLENAPESCTDAELSALRSALEIGDAVAGLTSPNPPVGAVVLDGAGAILGTGATQAVGGPHAEIVALQGLGEAALGATLVCSLEPCSHHGRTGPCTDAICDAGIRRVIFAATDPDPVAAGGADILRSRGLEVIAGQLPSETRRSGLGRWLTAVELNRPHVTWKYATTLDGRVAAADGSSRWITSATARADVHRLRAESDAVLVGSGTVLADDPRLTVRDPTGSGIGHQPLRVVFDRSGRVPADARVLDASAETMIWMGSIAEGLGVLFERGVRAVLLEGGPTLAAAFVRAGLVDRLVGYIAPALLGSGPSLVGDLGIGGIAGALRLVVEDVTRLGSDLRITTRPAVDPGTGAIEE